MTSSFERQLTELRGRVQSLEVKLEEQAQRIEALERAVWKTSAPHAGAATGQSSESHTEGRADVPSAILDV
jgi:predicted RNase H-like nuclease (RuvC/YqgF family)